MLVRSALKAYGTSPAVIEYKEFAGRGHSLTIDSGWQKLAEYCLARLQAKGLGLGDAARTQADELVCGCGRPQSVGPRAGSQGPTR